MQITVSANVFLLFNFFAEEVKIWFKDLLYSIQTSRHTYLNPPEGDEQLFLMWLEDFDIDAYDREINNLLSNCPLMRELYQELVSKVYKFLYGK